MIEVKLIEDSLSSRQQARPPWTFYHSGWRTRNTKEKHSPVRYRTDDVLRCPADLTAPLEIRQNVHCDYKIESSLQLTSQKIELLELYIRILD